MLLAQIAIIDFVNNKKLGKATKKILLLLYERYKLKHCNLVKTTGGK